MDANAKDTMMFDASFRRSRFYFEAIQLLRIFSDMIRETGRDLQTMISDPRMMMTRSYRESGYDRFTETPAEDSKKVIRANWELVEAQQKAAERRLLVRIAERSGDIQSLRDGVSFICSFHRKDWNMGGCLGSNMITNVTGKLFNATALLEASRSTAMSRYVFAFTIVTVVFLPPSFIAVGSSWRWRLALCPTQYNANRT